jgi:glycosyltransferase involved in cell wall biosynthesis
MNAVRVATLMLRTTPMSIRVYVDEIAKRLPQHGAEIVLFNDPAKVPGCDVLWDPRTGGGRAPTPQLLERPEPLVVTLHDVAHLSLPWREFYPTARQAIRGRLDAVRVRRRWRGALGRLHRVIVPSMVTKREAIHHLHMVGVPFEVIPHGVDHEVFSRNHQRNQNGGATGGRAPYFLHVSQYQKRKNIERLLQAYESLPRPRPRLVMKVLGPPSVVPIDGVEWIDGELPRDDLARLFAGALCFVFPSVSEGFGMSIAEAMAAGCPVVTSRDTACAEVADDAALLVDPYSVSSIAQALARVAYDEALRDELSARGVERATAFRWSTSAVMHARAFCNFRAA